MIIFNLLLNGSKHDAKQLKYITQLCFITEKKNMLDKVFVIVRHGGEIVLA